LLFEILIRAPVASSMPIPKGDITGGRGPGRFFFNPATIQRVIFPFDFPPAGSYCFRALANE
jgi:hypothetical protein